MRTRRTRGYLSRSPRWEQIRARLKAGVPAEQVARWLQNDCGEFIGDNTRSLARMLQLTRKDLAQKSAVESPAVREQIESMAVTVDVAEKEAQIIAGWERRIALAEWGTLDTVKTVSREDVKLYLAALVQHRDTLQSLGLLKKTPEVSEHRILVAAKIEAMTPQQQDALADRIWTMLNENG